MAGSRARSDASAVEDFVFDSDAPPSLPSPPDHWPDWLWVLVRASSEPKQQVWVRYQAEHAPEGLSVRAANPPRDGDDGVVVLPQREGAVTSDAGSPSGLVPLLSHVRAVAVARRDALHAIVSGLERNDHAAVIEHARALVGG